MAAGVLTTHVELTGRITNKNNTANSDHATHVAGTMMATGVNPSAKGMAYKMQAMDAYDFNNHLSEMLDASTSLLVSNHSTEKKQDGYLMKRRTDGSSGDLSIKMKIPASACTQMKPSSGTPSLTMRLSILS